MIKRKGYIMREITGIYIPSEEEVHNCMNGKSCEYGICTECSVGCVEEDNDNE